MAVESSGALPFPTFAVEITSLADFLTFIERELGVSLNSGVDRVKMDAWHSRQLAAGLAGAMIASSRNTYFDSQRFPVENLVRYLFTGVAMLEVIEQLMSMYKTTEELATLTTADVQGMLTAAYEQKYSDLKAVKAADGARDANPSGPEPVA